MCSGSEVGSYLRLIDVVYHSTLGLRVINKKRYKVGPKKSNPYTAYVHPDCEVPLREELKMV